MKCDPEFSDAYSLKWGGSIRGKAITKVHIQGRAACIWAGDAVDVSDVIGEQVEVLSDDGQLIACIHCTGVREEASNGPYWIIEGNLVP